MRSTSSRAYCHLQVKVTTDTLSYRPVQKVVVQVSDSFFTFCYVLVHVHSYPAVKSQFHVANVWQ